MSNGQVKDANTDAILAGGQDAINTYLVKTVAEILETCRTRPAQCAAASRRKWTNRRVLLAWALGLIFGGTTMALSIAAFVAG